VAEPGLTVRPATRADSNALFALLREFATSYTPDRIAFQANLPKLLKSNHQLLLVAAEDERVVGYVMAAESMTLYANGPTAELIELMVGKTRRKRGIGRVLVEAAMAWARERGCVEVNVPTRRAGDYYEKLGFEETASFYRCKL
jgi:ribosomal protein S18 acetylase RimI-like enzyme